MNEGVAPMRPRLSGRTRVWLAVFGGLFVAVSLLPPLSTLAAREDWAEALQFAFLAVAGPALVVLGAPWRTVGVSPSYLGRLAESRKRHPGAIRSVGFLFADLAVVVAWRTPAAVDAVAGRPWILLVEATSLMVVGIGLWLELVGSPPLVPRSSRPRRAGMAALAMWTIWTVAYVVAMSDVPWYRVFHHTAGVGLSASADHQLATVVLWIAAAVVFMPVVFWNLMQWLGAEEDPDDELSRLLRQERRRSTGAH
jgi:cytochrome c oxidase assembly factor CtaG